MRPQAEAGCPIVFHDLTAWCIPDEMRIRPVLTDYWTRATANLSPTLQCTLKLLVHWNGPAVALFGNPIFQRQRVADRSRRIEHHATV